MEGNGYREEDVFGEKRGSVNWLMVWGVISIITIIGLALIAFLPEKEFCEKGQQEVCIEEGKQHRVLELDEECAIYNPATEDIFTCPAESEPACIEEGQSYIPYNPDEEQVFTCAIGEIGSCE